jgi:hypothetical protein
MRYSASSGASASDATEDIGTRSRPLPLIMLVSLVAVGCKTAVDPSQYQSMNCAGLNEAVAQTSKEISATAITLANVDSYSVPFWALGGDRVKQALVDRNTRKLSELRSLQEQMFAERRRRCG